jgi:hypothetical protein
VALAGVAVVLTAIVDLVNTLVSTSTSPARWWPTRIVGRSTFIVLRAVARRMPEESTARERMLSAFGPLLLIELLVMWCALQITGFAMIWWSLGDVGNVGNFGEAWYYSGVVFFTLGFGEIVPTEIVPRTGAVAEAFLGVITVALVIGYLPTLYAAYSDRERQLMRLDAGSTDRITPTALVQAWAPDADPKKLDAQFEQWEVWAAGVLETHSSLPLLAMFRSHDRRQNWVTALGLLCDAALHTQIIMGATDGHAYWFLRRAEAIFREMTAGHDISAYEEAFRESQRDRSQFEQLYRRLTDHGFQLRPYDDAVEYSRIRASYAPAMEFLIDDLLCPRGFWSIDSTVPSYSSRYDLDRLS